MGLSLSLQLSCPAEFYFFMFFAGFNPLSPHRNRGTIMYRWIIRTYEIDAGYCKKFGVVVSLQSRDDAL